MGIDINRPDFVENFDLSEMTVGVVGHGYVGKAITSYFDGDCNICVYDKYKYDDTLEDLLKRSQLVFVCVPTPMNTDGSCHTGIVESVLDDIVTTASAIEKDFDSFIVVLKSTVNPGFTEKMKDKKGLRLVFSPEFLTERNSIQDFEMANRVVLGGDIVDAEIVWKFFAKKLGKTAAIVQCRPTSAELTKLFTNAFLAIKVTFANEMYRVCDAMGVKYDEVKALGALDRRIAYSHLDVPGPDGSFGFGGHCFPKDINNLRRVCAELGTGERLFSATIERNDEIREDKDWLDQKGRAVVEDYGEDDGSR